jgi:hypothetical protein
MMVRVSCKWAMKRKEMGFLDPEPDAQMCRCKRATRSHAEVDSLAKNVWNEKQRKVMGHLNRWFLVYTENG